MRYTYIVNTVDVYLNGGPFCKGKQLPHRISLTASAYLSFQYIGL